MVKQPAYVRIAGEIGRQIRSGELRAGTQLPSHADLAVQHGVSDIVIRKAVGLLRSQGLVRSRERRGTFVAESPRLVRSAPERQLETAEASFRNESGDVRVERDTEQIPVPAEIAEPLGVPAASEVMHTMTRIMVNKTPAAISDTYEPIPRAAIEPSDEDRTLDETLAIRPPNQAHGGYLGTPPGEMVVTIRQQFQSGGQTYMLADVTYPIDRYAAFVFRMQLPHDATSNTDATHE